LPEITIKTGGDLKPFREIDYKSLRLITERCEASDLKRRFMLKHLDNRWKEGRLFRGRDTTEQKWRLCEGRMMYGDFSDWDGWQYRDPWAAGLWHNPDRLGVPPWNGLRTGHLYIIGEQGVGDEIFFAQAIPACLQLADRVTFEGDPRVIPALTRMGVQNCISSNYVWQGNVKLRKMLPIEADCWIPLGDLPRVFCRLKDVRPPFAVNYITPDPEQVKKYEAYKGRVGISWRGAQGFYRAKEFAQVCENPLSLQYDQSPLESIERPQLDLKEDFEGLLGLLANLSKVYTVSTTVAHMASAMGVDTTVIIAPLNGRHKNMLNWKWSLLKRSPWYPNTKVHQSLREYLAGIR